jgi:hypothetical protein
MALTIHTKYVVGLLSWMAIYAVGVFMIPEAIKAAHLTGPLGYAVAASQALPVAGAIWVYLRYLDKLDEYLRAIMTKRFVTATGLTLVVCTAWGFLEQYMAAPRMPLYLIYPLLWGMFAVTTAFYRNSTVTA